MAAIETPYAVQPANALATLAEAPEDEPLYLVFALGQERYALGILAVQEIIEYDQVTSVPLTPPCIRGVVNLRGGAIPVVDLAVRFGQRPREASRRTCIVIVEVVSGPVHQKVGVVVDAVTEVLEIRADAIAPPPRLGASLRVDFIQGVGKVGDRLVTILAPDRLLPMDEAATFARREYMNS